MSKINKRDYCGMAKRPSKRGHGLADRRSRPEETPVEELLREAEEDLTALGEGEAEVAEAQEDAAIVEGAEPVFGKTYEQPQALNSIDGARSVTETIPEIPTEAEPESTDEEEAVE